MTQTRLFFTASEPDASRIFSELEIEFEDDGWPLAMTELDDATALQEISLYLDGEVPAAAQRLDRLVESTSGTSSVSAEPVPDIDWVAHALEGLQPVSAGRFMVHGSHDRDRPQPHQIGIEIDAGQAFGTGHHGTTSGCLDMIASIVRRERPANALDLGTGSAVLAIAIARLCRIPVLATDIDPVATAVAQQNIRLNGVTRYVTAATATGFQNKKILQAAPFDLIIANILARPLMALAPEMARNLASGGSVILSGILDRQRQAVLAAFRGQRFRHVRTISRDGWVTLHLKR